MIRVKQVKIKVQVDSKEVLEKKLEKLLHTKILNIIIKKKSIDARDKKQVFYVYDVLVEVGNEDKVLKIRGKQVFKDRDENYIFPKAGIQKLTSPIIIVGSGPAGLFAGYMLALKGYKPIIIERGEEIDKRVKRVEKFWETGELNIDSNVQFGEGGAGTFSDGKLNTLNKDKYFRGKKVLETFVKFGAPKEILYLQHPHIGTDILRNVVKNMRDNIISLGGEFRYNTKLTDIIFNNQELKEIVVNDKERISCNNLILAIGHSARDTFKMLYDKGIKMQAKAFAMGIRVMHDQEMINESQYKEFAKILPNANYKLTYQTKEGRGVYSFCMCPGGYVVNASSENNRLTINGMSNYKRDSGVANSAIIVTVSPSDYGFLPLDGIEFQRKLEEKAYLVGNGFIPIQLWKDFKLNKESKSLGDIKPAIKGKYKLSNLNLVLPHFMIEALKEGMENFGKKIKGFDRDDTIICGVEARSSSPVRILRDEDMMASIKGIYPIGEGAGYAGGITTSAIDGIKVAEKIIEKYKSE